MIRDDEISKYGVALPARIINWDDYSPRYSPLSGLGQIELGSKIPATLQAQYQGLLTDIEKYVGPVGADPRDFRVGFMAEQYRAAAVRRFIDIRTRLRTMYENVLRGTKPVSQLSTLIVSSRTNLYREIKTTEADIRDQKGAMGDRTRQEQLAEDAAERIRREKLVEPWETAEGVAEKAGIIIGAGAEAAGKAITVPFKAVGEMLKGAKWVLPVAAVAAVAILGVRFMPKKRRK